MMVACPPPFLETNRYVWWWYRCAFVFVRAFITVAAAAETVGRTSRNNVLLFSFPSVTIKITYILHWVIRPWLSHVFIRLIGHKALVNKGGKSAPIVGRCDQYIQWSRVERIKHMEVHGVEEEGTHGCV